MTWYEKALKSYKKEAYNGAIFFLCLLFAIAIWKYVLGYSFQWQWIEPIEQPSIFMRIVYSALTFYTLGRLLFKARFYQFLRAISGDKKSFREAKAIIWLVLMLLMFAVIVPTVVYILNFVASIAYNLVVLLIYLFPPLGISAIFTIIFFLLYRQIWTYPGKVAK